MGSKPTETPAEPPVSFLKENWIWIVAPMVLILGAMAWQVYFSGPDAEPATLTGAQTADFVIPSGETWTMQIAVDGGEPQLITIQGTGGPVRRRDVATQIDGLDHVSAKWSAGVIELETDRAGRGASLRLISGAADQDLAAACGLSPGTVWGSSDNDIAPHQYPMFD